MNEAPSLRGPVSLSIVPVVTSELVLPHGASRRTPRFVTVRVIQTCDTVTSEPKNWKSRRGEVRATIRVEFDGCLIGDSVLYAVETK